MSLSAFMVIMVLPRSADGSRTRKVSGLKDRRLYQFAHRARRRPDLTPASLPYRHPAVTEVTRPNVRDRRAPGGTRTPANRHVEAALCH